jgi:hypothetical protein
MHFAGKSGEHGTKTQHTGTFCNFPENSGFPMRSNKKFVMAPARTSPNEMPIEFLTVLTIMLSVASGSQK